MIWSVKQEAIIGNDLCSHGPFMQKIINVSTNHQTKNFIFIQLFSSVHLTSVKTKEILLYLFRFFTCIIKQALFNPGVRYWIL